MKKLLCLVISLILIAGIATGVLAEGYSANFPMEAGLLVNMDTGEILFSKNTSNPIAPLGAAKLLTALVAIEQSVALDTAATLDESMLIGVDTLETDTFLHTGDQITLRDLLIESLLTPAEDGALILANYFGGQELFVQKMNQKAADLGMENSTFLNPHGADAEGQYTTVDDLLILTEAVTRDPDLAAIVKMAEYTFSPSASCSLDMKAENENLLLVEGTEIGGAYLPSATGLMAWHDDNRASLIATAEESGKHLACILIGDASENYIERWYVAKDMLTYGFANTAVPTLPPETEPAITETAAPETEETAVPETEAETAPTVSSSEIAQQMKQHENRRIAIVILFLFAVLLLLGTIIRLILRHQRNKALLAMGYEDFHDPAGIILTVVMIIATLIVNAVTLLCMWQYRNTLAPSETVSTSTTQSVTETTVAPTTVPTETEAPTSPETLPPETVPETKPEPVFAPHHTAVTDPANWGIQWNVIVDDEFVEDYQREEPIFFDAPETYYPGDGVITFRGNNYRNGPNYGSADLSNGSMDYRWSVGVGDFNSWSGCGWTGQPLVVRWDSQTRAIMNLYESKKEKEDLVEIIYATLDGYIYFLDLDDGTQTRDPLWIGHNFKGAGALDPRGYPVLYVGSGDYVGNTSPRMFIISLIDGSILYSGGHNEAHSLRGWNGFDSSPLVDAETDTLIWPGENGLLFTIKLNSEFDQSAGTFTINPDRPVMAQYTTARTSTYEYWVGFEDSVVIVDHYMYLSDNGGMFFCVDINTMELIWAQDTTDDSNSTPVFEWGKDGNGYIYTAPSLHYTTDDGVWGDISIYKLDAQTGEIIWERPFEVGTVPGVSGGVQSTPLLGKPGSSIEDLIIYTVSRTPDIESGVIVAIDKQNGSIVWQNSMQCYAWSSPTAIYDEDGTSYIFIGDFTGGAFLLDGATGEILDSADLGSNIEASPVVFENKLIIGTRAADIYMLEIS